jgi:hypothetical protein
MEPNNQDRRLSFLRPRAMAVVLLAMMLLNCDLWREVARNNNRNIVNATFTVTMVGYWTYPIEVTDKMDDVRVEGTFSVTGGDPSVIRTMVMEDREYEKFTNGKSFYTLYDSQRTSSGQIIADLPTAGTYRLVFDNDWSMDDKSVTADVDMKWR